jgi:hypothetical protein
MIPSEIQRGRPLTPENYNSLVQTVMANRLAPGAGYTVIQTPRGTALAIAPQRGGGGGSAGVCPWQVSLDVTDPQTPKITIAWGLVGPQGVLPIGMQYSDNPKLTINWQNGFVVMTVTFKSDSGLIDTVKFEIKTDIPEQSETEAYYPIARLSTVTPEGGDPQRIIQNLCSAPVPSVCDLKFVSA